MRRLSVREREREIGKEEREQGMFPSLDIRKEIKGIYNA
jgi:hypothetical protein